MPEVRAAVSRWQDTAGEVAELWVHSLRVTCGVYHHPADSVGVLVFLFRIVRVMEVHLFSRFGKNKVSLLSSFCTVFERLKMPGARTGVRTLCRSFSWVARLAAESILS